MAECQTVLGLGGGAKAEQRRRYRDYVERAVREGLEQSPWESVQEQVALGSAEFLASLRKQIDGDEQEQRAARRLLGERPPFETLVRDEIAGTGEVGGIAELRRISFGSQSEKGARTREVLMSILHTLRKRGGDTTASFKRALNMLAGDDALHPYDALSRSIHHDTRLNPQLRGYPEELLLPRRRREHVAYSAFALATFSCQNFSAV